MIENDMVSEPMGGINNVPSNGVVLSFDRLWNLIESLHLNPSVRRRLGERLLTSADHQNTTEGVLKKRKLIVSEKVRLLAGSLSMDVPEDWKTDKSDYLVNKHFGQ